MPELSLSDAINPACPWSGKPIRADSLTLYREALVGFCNPGCRDKFEAATTLFDGALAERRAGPTLRQLAGLAPSPARLGEATLVVIDAQEDYRTGALPLEGIEAALVRLAALLDRARTLGTPIVHVLHRGTPGGLFDPAGPGGAPCGLAVPRSGEAIVEKGSPNAFARTGLQEHLVGAGRHKLLLAGFMTHMCVSSTARAAIDLGHRVTIVADATATRALPDPLAAGLVPARQVQRTALAELADRFADVATSDLIGD